LGNNMFAYCRNNPVQHSDPGGERANIWPVLFEEHDPGYIHRMVQLHIIANTILQKELVLPGFGRADIFNPETGEIWEIKHGGNSMAMRSARTNDAQQQIARYVLFTEITLKPGHANAFAGNFVINCDGISYYVEYDTPAAGTILYYVQQMQSYDPLPYTVKVRKKHPIPQTTDMKYAYIAVGLIALGCVGAMRISLQAETYAT